MAFDLPRHETFISLPFPPDTPNSVRGKYQRAFIKRLREQYARPLQKQLRAAAPRASKRQRTSGLLRRNIRVTVTSQLGYKVRIRFDVSTTKVPYAGFVVREWESLYGSVQDLFVKTFLATHARIRRLQEETAREILQGDLSRFRFTQAAKQRTASKAEQERLELESELGVKKLQRENERLRRLWTREADKRLRRLNTRLTGNR